MLVGPTGNPAGINMADSAQTAFQKIATAGSPFASRHDNSGTNAKELAIWASLSPANPQTGASWYYASGTMGMADALSFANQQGAYTLSDSSTWYFLDHFKAYKSIKLINAGDPTYQNQYSVIEVKGAQNAEGAQDFRRWIMSPSVQHTIATYGYSTLGRYLFTANAGSY
jgi:tungstate transport system substrate-binding protein